MIPRCDYLRRCWLSCHLPKVIWAHPKTILDPPQGARNYRAAQAQHHRRRWSAEDREKESFSAICEGSDVDVSGASKDSLMWAVVNRLTWWVTDDLLIPAGVVTGAKRGVDALPQHVANLKVALQDSKTTLDHCRTLTSFHYAVPQHLKDAAASVLARIRETAAAPSSEPAADSTPASSKRRARGVAPDGHTPKCPKVSAKEAARARAAAMCAPTA